MTQSLKIVLASDRRGEEVARHVADLLKCDGHEVQWSRSANADQEAGAFDYPDEAYRVASIVTAGQAEFGILVSGSAIGMCITANKCKDVRAVIAHDEWIVRRARAHHDCNVLCIPADLIGLPLIRSILDTWIDTPFEGGRHDRRVRKIGMVEEGKDPAEYVEEDEASSS